MALRDAVDGGDRAGREDHERHAGALGGRPEPVRGAVGEPRLLQLRVEREPHAEHPGLLRPAVDERAALPHEVASGPLRADALAHRLASVPGATSDSEDEEIVSEALPSVGMRDVLRLSLEAAQGALTRHAPGCTRTAPDILITVPKDACRTLEFHRAAELVDLGRELARKALDGAPLEDA